MRKNVKQQLALRVLSTAALMAMVSSIATAAFADTYDLTKGSVDILAANGEQHITQWADKDNGLYVKDGEGKDICDINDPKIVLTTKDKTTGETKTTSNTVTITAETENDTANVTLENVDIEQPDSHWSGNTDPAPIEIKGDGNTNLELNGNNTVLSGNGKHAGIEKADVNGTGTLTIKDDVNDDGTAKTGTEADTTGKLVAGGYDNGAGIGGGGYHDGKSYADTSNITITGGEITAIGGHGGGAGIGGGGRDHGGTAKNICIEGNAHVTAASAEGAAIGGGATGGNSITITDDAVVDAYGTWGSAIGDGGMGNGWDSSATTIPTTAITISGNATVHAETSQKGCAIGTGYHGSVNNLTINIEENANVTAISSYDVPAIGNAFCRNDSTTTINITGGTVNAINSFGSDSPSFPNDGTHDVSPAIGGNIFDVYSDGDNHATCNVNINSSTGDTVVNAYIYGKGSGTAIGSAHSHHTYIPADGTSYHADGSSYFGESHSAIVNCYNNGTVKKEKLDLPSTTNSIVLEDHEYRHTITGGTLTKVVHNRKYMEENPNIDTSKLKDEDLHDWKLVGKVVEPTLEKDGYADYVCSIDKCGQTKHVVLPKLTPEPSEPDTPSTPETPDTPDTPNKPDTPKQPDGTTPAPVTPDAPAQDGTAPADTPAADTTADAAATPAAAQNVVQNAKPEAAAPAAAAVLPQTGANWLAVVGSALSGMFLLAAGFVLDRKGRRMN